MPDWSSHTVTVSAHLIFRYHLPLKQQVYILAPTRLQFILQKTIFYEQKLLVI